MIRLCYVKVELTCATSFIYYNLLVMSNIGSKLVFGGASLSGKGGGYGFGEMSEKQSQELIDSVLEMGLSQFDTAPIYGFGRSESILGRFLTEKREKVKIITKGGVGWHENRRVNMSNAPKVIETMLHDSLERLGDTYIDYYLVHYPDPKVDIRKTLEPIIKAQEAGKIRNIGLSNTTDSEIKLASEVAKIELVQNQCNLFENAFEDIDRGDFITMGWGTLDKGILSERVDTKRKYDEEDFRSWAPWWKKSDWKDRVAKVSAFKENHPASNLLNLALHYSLNHCDSIICGAKKADDLRELIKELTRPEIFSEEVAKAFNEYT